MAPKSLGAPGQIPAVLVGDGQYLVDTSVHLRDPTMSRWLMGFKAYYWDTHPDLIALWGG